MSIVLTNDPPPPYQGRLYYAIRSCEYLRGPAIFLEREDCSVYFEKQNDEEGACEYKICRSLQQAVAFIEPSLVVAPALEPANSKNAPLLITAASPKKKPARKRDNSPFVSHEPPAKKVKLQSRTKLRYDENIAILQEYKEKHGTCDIPVKHPSIMNTKFEILPRWISEMRKEIKAGGERIGAERMKRLLDAGFCMTPNRGFSERSKLLLEQVASQFDGMLAELCVFKDKHGHCNVPDHLGPEKKRTPLRTWIIRLRHEYTKMKQGKDSILNVERVAQLSGLGFDLASPHRRRTFEDRAYEWLEYRTKHGQEPRRESEAEGLAVWTTKIRSKYEMKKAGEKTNITQEQIDLLTKWGFKWEADSKFAPKNNGVQTKKWEERFDDLLAYKDEHGHCQVPQSYPGLGPWVKRQRKEGTQMRRNLKSRLTQEKIDTLTAAGFVWEVRPSFGGTKKTPPRASYPDSESSSDEEEEQQEPIAHRNQPLVQDYATNATNHYMRNRYNLY
jgi:hypothetical protein